MRPESEMMDLILETAKKDARVRAVILNGSRANPNAPKDNYQDFDIVYIVTELESFTDDHHWIDVFGNRLMLQMPETMRNPGGDGRFIYLMLFDDGNRIDLQLIPIRMSEKLRNTDSESILLLDKDNIFSPFPPASDSDYHIKAPSELDYISCCNNFWWCTQNVAKGILRYELPYSKQMYHNIVLGELHDMIAWYIGCRHDFKVSVGYLDKYISRYLEKQYYELYLNVYSDSAFEHMWESLFTACSLFRILARQVGKHFLYAYPENDDKNMTEYLTLMRNLPRENY